MPRLWQRPSCSPFPPAVELLRSAKWQERVEAMGAVLEAVQALGDPGPRCYELVQCVAFLPGWADKNFQVGCTGLAWCSGGLALWGLARMHVRHAAPRWLQPQPRPAAVGDRPSGSHLTHLVDHTLPLPPAAGAEQGV